MCVCIYERVSLSVRMHTHIQVLFLPIQREMAGTTHFHALIRVQILIMAMAERDLDRNLASRRFSLILLVATAVGLLLFA